MAFFSNGVHEFVFFGLEKQTEFVEVVLLDREDVQLFLFDFVHDFLILLLRDLRNLLTWLLLNFLEILDHMSIFGLRLALGGSIALGGIQNGRVSVQMEVRGAPFDKMPVLFEYDVADTHELIIPDSTDLVEIGLQRLEVLAEFTFLRVRHSCSFDIDGTADQVDRASQEHDFHYPVFRIRYDLINQLPVNFKALSFSRRFQRTNIRMSLDILHEFCTVRHEFFLEIVK